MFDEKRAYVLFSFFISTSPYNADFDGDEMNLQYVLSLSLASRYGVLNLTIRSLLAS